MRKYKVTGMSCAACSARVERAVAGVPGVSDCAVNLLTGQLSFEGDASEESIIAAVEKAGYGIEKAEEPGAASRPEDTAEADLPGQREFVKLRRSILVSLVPVVLLMYLSMGYHMFGLPLPGALEKPAVNASVQMVLAAFVMLIHSRFFRNGTRGLLHAAPNMDTLVAIGSAASFAYSAAGLVRIFAAVSDGRAQEAHSILGDLYFDSAAMILLLITVGKTLEAYSKGRTTDALRGLYSLAPKTARLLRDGATVTVPVAEVVVGDIFCVLPGETIPADGIVTEGESAVDESALTGESIPVDKKPGDTVATATGNRSGRLICRATAVGEDNTLSKIIRMVSDATATKAPIANLADRIAGVFVPIVIAIAVITIAVWMAVGQTFGYALARGVSVLVISCPCALGLATPVAIMVGNGVAARHGILFKTAAALEHCGRVGVIAFDKTGTITEGVPAVTDQVPAEGVSREELLRYAALAECYSEHPLAKAILAAAGEVNTDGITQFRVLSGSGVSCLWQGKELLSGKAGMLGVPVPDAAADMASRLAKEGKTPLHFAYDGRYLGMIAVADTVREDSAEAVAMLRKMDVRPVMITGDRKETAAVIADRVGIREVSAEVLPDGKQQVIRGLQQSGALTAMVGDGINDAPALTAADIGIAIGTGTEIAVEAAEVVVMNRRLLDVCAAVSVSRSTLRIIRQNLAWAFVYNLIGIPLAAGAFVHLTGWELNPMFGAAAMSLSSFCVVMNALRLNRWKYPTVQVQTDEPEGISPSMQAQTDEPGEISPAVQEQKKESGEASPKEESMNTITLRVEGMMCAHCEARVKKSLEEVPGVIGAAVSAADKTAVVTAEPSVSAESLVTAVTAQGYEAFPA